MDTDCGLFQYYRFLPLDVSLEARNWWMEFNNTNFTEVYKPDLLPLFEFENEFYCIQCSHKKEESGSIWFVYHDTYQVYDSLTTMLLAVWECYETGAYQPTLKFYDLRDSNSCYIETKIDERQAAEIQLKHNPIRQERFEDLRTDTPWYPHKHWYHRP